MNSMSSIKMPIIKKIVLLGNAGVGKTSLIRRFITGYFNPSYLVTLGTTILQKDVEYEDQQVTLTMWDIGGQETFKAVRSKYYYGAEGALAVCDLSDKQTLTDLSSWIDAFRAVVGDKPIVLVGNKSDLPNLQVHKNDLIELSQQYNNSVFIITSAKDGVNAENCFLEITQLMFNNKFKENVKK